MFRFPAKCVNGDFFSECEICLLFEMDRLEKFGFVIKVYFGIHTFEELLKNKGFQLFLFFECEISEYKMSECKISECVK